MAIKFNSIFVKADKALRECLDNKPDVEYVHGLLTAVLCNPEIIPTTVYLGFIFDKNQKDGKGLKNFDEAQELMGVITDLYNHVNDQLREETFEPHISPETEHVDLAMTENWCKGFFEGTALWNDSARAYPAVNAHLMTIYYFANQNKPGLKESDKKQVEKLDKYVTDKRENIKNNVLGIYAELSGMKEEVSETKTKPFIKVEPKVDRNDPCPCGSGKKYKKCCGK